MGAGRMSAWKAKRFWKTAEIRPEAGGYGVYLDTRPVKTPAKAPLVLPSEGFAEAVRAEWEAVDEQIDPTRMPFTRTANAAIDKVSVQQAEVADMIADYGGTDLLCYRAEAPEALRQRQNAGWDPLLDWADETFGARLAVTSGVMHLSQDAAAMQALWEDLLTLDERATIAGIDRPYLVCSGAQSRVYPASAATWLAQAAPQARHQVFARSGHSPHLEEPAAMSDALRRFIRALPA